MHAKDEILARVRGALAEVSRPGPGVTPIPWTYAAGADLPDVPDVASLFAERVEDYRAVVTRATADGIPRAIAAALGEARRVVVPDGVPRAWLDALDDVEVVEDNSGESLSAATLDQVDAVITGAAVGIAVTGTIVLDHGPDQGRRALSLVPDLHVCVIHADQLADDVPAGLARLAPALAAGHPLTWISGPSATSDIELDRVEGVHGPRQLHVVLVG